MARKPQKWPRWEEIEKLDFPATIVSFDETRQEYFIDTGRENLYCSAERIVNGTCLPDEPLAAPNPEPPSSASVAGTPEPPVNEVAPVEAPIVPKPTPDVETAETLVPEKASSTNLKVGMVFAVPMGVPLEEEIPFLPDDAKTQWLSLMGEQGLLALPSSDTPTDYATMDAAYRDQLTRDLFVLMNSAGVFEDQPMSWSDFEKSFAYTSTAQLANLGRETSSLVIQQQYEQSQVEPEPDTPQSNDSFWFTGQPFLPKPETYNPLHSQLIDADYDIPFGPQQSDEVLVDEALARTSVLAPGYLAAAGLDVVRQDVEASDETGQQWKPETDGPLLEQLNASIHKMRDKTQNGSPIFGLPTQPVIESFEAFSKAMQQKGEDLALVSEYDQAQQQGDVGAFLQGLLEFGIGMTDIGDPLLAIDDLLKGEADGWTLLSLLPFINSAATRAGRLANRALGWTDETSFFARKADEISWRFFDGEYKSPKGRFSEGSLEKIAQSTVDSTKKMRKNVLTSYLLTLDNYDEIIERMSPDDIRKLSEISLDRSKDAVIILHKYGLEAGLAINEPSEFFGSRYGKSIKLEFQDPNFIPPVIFQGDLCKIDGVTNPGGCVIASVSTYFGLDPSISKDQDSILKIMETLEWQKTGSNGADLEDVSKAYGGQMAWSWRSPSDWITGSNTTLSRAETALNEGKFVIASVKDAEEIIVKNGKQYVITKVEPARFGGFGGPLLTLTEVTKDATGELQFIGDPLPPIISTSVRYTHTGHAVIIQEITDTYVIVLNPASQAYEFYDRAKFLEIFRNAVILPERS